MNTLNPMQKLKYYFHAEKIHEQIREEISKEMPLVVSNHEYNEDEIINGYTTYELFTLNRALVHTKELGVKKSKYNYITAILAIGIRIIKNKKGDK